MVAFDHRWTRQRRQYRRRSEIFDPGTQTSTAGATLTTARVIHRDPPGPMAAYSEPVAQATSAIVIRCFLILQT